jgi:glycosyltransferase involved in cell wall biosynthesis
VVARALVKRRVDIDFAEGLARIIAEDKPHVVHSHMFASTAAAALAQDEVPVPLVVHEHSEATWRDPVARRVATDAYAKSAAVVAVSAAIQRRLIGVDGVPAEKVHLLPNTLPARCRSTHLGGLPRDRSPLVGVVARLQPEKGVAVFLQAAAKIRQSLPDVGFVVIGDGPQRTALERLAADLALPVRFLGFQPDAPALIGALDVLVVPSFTEGTPLVVLEAGAAGVPVVATAVGGIPEQVRHGIEALLVAPGDDNALAKACLRVLRDKVLRAKLATAARQRLHERPDREAGVRAIEALYGRIVSRKPELRRPSVNRISLETSLQVARGGI